MISILFANAIAADAGLIPGLAIFGPAMGLPVSLLAAFIERPFVTRAGFEKNAIWFSLQANFVSLLVGYVATMFVIPLAMGPGTELLFGLVWPFLAVGISIATERRYLELRLRNRVPWAPVAMGNIISAVTCIAVMVFVANLRDDVPELCERLRESEMTMHLIVAAVCLILFVGSFAATNPTGASTPTAERSE